VGGVREKVDTEAWLVFVLKVERETLSRGRDENGERESGAARKQRMGKPYGGGSAWGVLRGEERNDLVSEELIGKKNRCRAGGEGDGVIEEERCEGREGAELGGELSCRGKKYSLSEEKNNRRRARSGPVAVGSMKNILYRIKKKKGRRRGNSNGEEVSHHRGSPRKGCGRRAELSISLIKGKALRASSAYLSR